MMAEDGPVIIKSTHSGGYYRKRAQAEEILKRVLGDLSKTEIDFVISSANGTFIDQAECRALKQITPNAFVYTVKPALGESVGAAGLWQVIIGAQALRYSELPPLLHAGPTIPLRISASRIDRKSTRLNSSHTV